MADESADNTVSKPIRSLHDDLLPVVYRAGSQQTDFIAPGNDLAAYLEEEFSPQKFADLGQYIWMAGRPYPARPLNIQRVLGRQIVPTNDISLHLVWTTGKIFVKPLPRFLLTEEFYKVHLSNVSDPKIHRLNRQLLGFLWSYVALLPTELDFRIACKHDLIVTDQEVPTADWKRWRGVVKQVLTHYKTDDRPSTSDHSRVYVYDLIPQRYKYGELRLSRLDKISRIQGNVHHGWSSLTGTTRYNDWVVKYFTPIAASVAYLVVLLSALQVGLATEKLNQSWMFQNVSVGFTLLALVTLVVAIGSGVLLLLGMFILNWIKSAIISRRSNKQRQAED